MRMGRRAGRGIRVCRIGGRGGIFEGGLRVVVVSASQVTFRCCHGPSIPVKHAGREWRAAQPDAPECGAEKKVGPLRSLRFRSGQAG
jgi:hypothetical protein